MVKVYVPDMPEHDQLNIHAGLPGEKPGRLGAGTVYPCAIPGISLTDYSTNPQGKGWGPHCTGPFTTITLSDGVKLTVDSRIAELVTLIMNANLHDGYVYRQAYTGAYNCRYIAGTTIWSNHAWGLAIDEDWDTNPQKSPLTTDKPTWLRQRYNRYGFAWGGNYNSPTVPDAMHFEFMGTPAQCVSATNLARTELAGGGTPPPVDSGPALPAWSLPAGHFYGPTATSTEHNGSIAGDRPTIKDIQQRLIFKDCVSGVAASSWSTSTWADGYYGTNTANAMTTWHSRFYPQPYPSQCWSDDYAKLGA